MCLKDKPLINSSDKSNSSAYKPAPHAFQRSEGLGPDSGYMQAAFYSVKFSQKKNPYLPEWLAATSKKKPILFKIVQIAKSCIFQVHFN